MESKVVYFGGLNPENTDATFRLVQEQLKSLGVAGAGLHHRRHGQEGHGILQRSGCQSYRCSPPITTSAEIKILSPRSW